MVNIGRLFDLYVSKEASSRLSSFSLPTADSKGEIGAVFVTRLRHDPTADHGRARYLLLLTPAELPPDLRQGLVSRLEENAGIEFNKLLHARSLKSVENERSWVVEVCTELDRLDGVELLSPLTIQRPPAKETPADIESLETEPHQTSGEAALIPGPAGPAGPPGPTGPPGPPGPASRHLSNVLLTTVFSVFLLGAFGSSIWNNLRLRETENSANSSLNKVKDTLSEVQELLSGPKGAESQRGDLLARLSDLRDSVDSLEGRERDISQGLTGVEGTAVEVGQGLAKLQEAIVAGGERLASLGNKIEPLEHSERNLTNSIAKLGPKIKQLEKSERRLSKTVADLAPRVAQLTASEIELSMAAESLTPRLNSLKQDTRAIAQAFEQLTALLTESPEIGRAVEELGEEIIANVKLADDLKRLALEGGADIEKLNQELVKIAKARGRVQSGLEQAAAALGQVEEVGEHADTLRKRARVLRDRLIQVTTAPNGEVGLLKAQLDDVENRIRLLNSRAKTDTSRDSTPAVSHDVEPSSLRQRAVQQFIERQGVEIEVDGDIGPGTRIAAKEYLEKNWDFVLRDIVVIKHAEQHKQISPTTLSELSLKDFVELFESLASR